MAFFPTAGPWQRVLPNGTPPHSGLSRSGGRTTFPAPDTPSAGLKSGLFPGEPAPGTSVVRTPIPS